MPLAGVLLDRLVGDGAGLVEVALLGIRERGEGALPGRRLEDDTGLRSDRQDCGSVLGGDRAAPRSRTDEDDCPGLGLELVVTEREPRTAAEDDVHLFVA